MGACAEAGEKFKLEPAEGEEGEYQVELLGGLRASLTIPKAWPEGSACPHIKELKTPSGVAVSAEVLKQLQPGQESVSLVQLLEKASEQVGSAFGQA